MPWGTTRVAAQRSGSLRAEPNGAYTESGVIGYPSYSTAGKGTAILTSLTESFADHLEALGEES